MFVEMRAPAYWESDRGIAPKLLRPIAEIVSAGGVIRRMMARPVRLPVPVICVGNLVVGGAGKTPLVLSLLPLLRKLVQETSAIHILSRGYGGRVRDPLRVDVNLHDADLVGDEPLLLARAAPTWVGRNRPLAARAAIAEGARLLLLDDGFQDPSLAKSLSLLVIDGQYGVGNGLVFPAGPLREPVARGLARADAVVAVGEDWKGVPQSCPRKVPLLRVDMHLEPQIRSQAQRPIFAFAGIGRPEKFFDMLRNNGLMLAGVRSFPDHHRYRPTEVKALLKSAAALQAIPVTTEKDHVRLPPEVRSRVRTVQVAVRWNEPEAISAILKSTICL